MKDQIIVKQNEDLLLPVIWTGKETELSYDIKLAEPGAKVTFLALLLGTNDSTLDLKANVTHAARETKSEVIVRSALKQKASVNFEGMVTIDPGAKGTTAWLAAHILLLSKTARGRAIPSLEILENDIKAGHATTVGRINDKEVFYIMSRGIPETKAKQLIVQGYLQNLIDRFPEQKKVQAEKELELFGNEK
jgi:Fe-S cluster assembly protein SufD